MSKATTTVTHEEHQPLLAPVSCHFVDKAKMLSTLGYVFNASGVTMPAHKRAGRLVYKARRDTHTLFEGILYQDRKIGAESATPLVNESLMWVDYPRCWRTPSVWIVTKNLVGVQCVPRNCAVVPKKESRSLLNLWIADRWDVTPGELPTSIRDTLESLRTRGMGLPELLTVDCLDDQVLDVHSGNPIVEIDPTSSSKKRLVFSLGYQDRPFYDAGVLAYSIRVV